MYIKAAILSFLVSFAALSVADDITDTLRVQEKIVFNAGIELSITNDLLYANGAFQANGRVEGLTLGIGSNTLSNVNDFLAYNGLGQHMAVYRDLGSMSGNITISATNGTAQRIYLTGASTNVYSVGTNGLNSVTVIYHGVTNYALDFASAVWRGSEPSFTNAILEVDFILRGAAGKTEARVADERDGEW